MTLFDLAKKNIKGNFKNYLVYFISMLFSVVIYYTFVSLQYSTEIARSVESSNAMKSIFMIASIILILFVGVFILYSNNFFARKRKREIGLYSLLGLQKKTIGKMLFYENLIMGAIVLVSGIAIGTFLSKLFSMILLRLLGTAVDVGMDFSIAAVVNTIIVFTTIILFTSIQGYRMIFKFKLIELFRAEQKGEQEPKASIVTAILSIILLVVGYYFAFQELTVNKEILRNIGIMAGGIILSTILFFSSLIVFLLKFEKRNKRKYYNGMNLISTSNLVYRIKGNARTLSVISLLCAIALCAFSVGVGAYYGFKDTARLTAPFSYMYISQDDSFNQAVDSIIRNDEQHPVSVHMTIPIIKLKGQASNTNILSEREFRADEYPIKVIAIDEYNKVADSLSFPNISLNDNNKAIAIRPMYTDKEFSDYEGETISIELPQGNMPFEFESLTVERVINWSYPDIMIIVSEEAFEGIKTQVSPINYIGYAVQDQKTTKNTANELSVIKTPESNLSTFYSEYRIGIEGAAFNVFILGFLGLVFILATGSIIYFKQLTEASDDKIRYEILKKIGVSSKEINISILKQNTFIFFLPLIVGLAHYIVILNLLKRLFSAMAGVNMILPILICISVFVLVYVVYYVITVNTISKMVNGMSSKVVKIAMIIVGFFMISLIGILIWALPPVEKDEPYFGEKIYLELPKPTGTYKVGTTEMHLVDENRVDPWVNDKTRELMISIYYPTDEEGEEKALYMQPGTAKDYDENTITTVGIDPGRIDLSGVGTNSWIGVPVAYNEEGWPVILYSPGASVPRNFGTVLVEELASRGYVVVTVDHTYEASAVEFPGGRIETLKLPAFSAEVILKILDIRIDDMRFVLDQLTIIQEGGNPDYELRELPVGLNKALDLSNVGIFGHSAGGATAAQSMYEDDRLDAGIDMDGTMGHMPDYPLPVAKEGLENPFMLMNSGYNSDGEIDSHLTALDRNMFWENTSGWKLDLAVPKGAHFTFTDYQYLFPQIDKRLSVSPMVIQQSIGTADPEQMLASQRAYINAFFDLHLKGVPQPLLDRQSTIYTEVEFVE